jgi:hypothetical protein
MMRILSHFHHYRRFGWTSLGHKLGKTELKTLTYVSLDSQEKGTSSLIIMKLQTIKDKEKIIQVANGRNGIAADFS